MEINRVSLKQRMSTLKKHPGSMVVFLLTIAAAVIEGRQGEQDAPEAEQAAGEQTVEEAPAEEKAE